VGLIRTAVVALGCVVLAACGDAASDPATMPPETGSPSAAATSVLTPPKTATRPDATCDPARPRSTGDSEGSISSGGLEREYLLHLPASYDGRVPLPLVINLHGFGSNARDQDRYSRFPAKADEAGFIVVAPEGTGDPPRWTFPGLGSVDDVAFIADLLDALEAELCIDATRIYAAGMSNGAAITTFIACGLPDRIAAIGAVAATAGPRACGTDRPIPIISFRATEDQCVPYTGGTSACGMRLPVVAAEEAIRLWAGHNRCPAEPEVSQVSEHVRLTAYAGCDADASVVLYTVEGDGHTWPGAASVPRLGPVTTEIDATALMWEFFAAHPLP